MQQPITIAVLSRCGLARGGIERLASDLNAEITVIEAASPSELIIRMGTSVVTVLITDVPMYEDAVSLARRTNVPLAIITADLCHALLLASNTHLAGILPQPLAPDMMAELITAIMSGAPYRPPDSAYQGILTAREREVLHHRRRGHSVEATAVIMNIDPETVDRYERRIRERLRDTPLLERVA